MIRYILIGSSLALAAALQPGPLQVFYFSKVAEVGWKRTLPAALAPLISDGPIAALALLILGEIPPGARYVLQTGGGILLLIYAASTYRSWREGEASSSSPSSAPRNLLQAALVNLLNPNPYLAWSLVMGPAVLNAWSTKPLYGGALVLTFYLVMIGTSMALIILLGATTHLKPSVRRSLLLVSALLLAGLGGYYLTAGARGLAAAL